MVGPAREEILREIQRCAAENNGVPLGIDRFEEATGIRVADWAGKYWARWGDAVTEAGLTPNAMTSQKLSDQELVALLAALARQLGRFPTSRELRLQRRADPAYPNEKVFWNRLGSQSEQVSRVAAYAAERDELADVHKLCLELLDQTKANADEEDASEPRGADGYVYLLRVGRNYKIGRASSFERRERELAIQLPERAERVHVIRTDDPVGIERYWHQRFAAQRRNGEWFALSANDVRAFKRRKFM